MVNSEDRNMATYQVLHCLIYESFHLDISTILTWIGIVRSISHLIQCRLFLYKTPHYNMDLKIK